MASNFSVEVNAGSSCAVVERRGSCDCGETKDPAKSRNKPEPNTKTEVLMESLLQTGLLLLSGNFRARAVPQIAAYKSVCMLLTAGHFAGTVTTQEQDRTVRSPPPSSLATSKPSLSLRERQRGYLSPQMASNPCSIRGTSPPTP